MADANPQYVPNARQVDLVVGLLRGAFEAARKASTLAADDSYAYRQTVMLNLKDAAFLLGCDLVPTTPGQVRE